MEHSITLSTIFWQYYTSAPPLIISAKIVGPAKGYQQQFPAVLRSELPLVLFPLNLWTRRMILAKIFSPQQYSNQSYFHWVYPLKVLCQQTCRATHLAIPAGFEYNLNNISNKLRQYSNQSYSFSYSSCLLKQ